MAISTQLSLKKKLFKRNKRFSRDKFCKYIALEKPEASNINFIIN